MSPNSLATSGGQRPRRSAAPAIPSGRRLTAQQPCTPSGCCRLEIDSQISRYMPCTPPADVVDTTRRPFDPQRTPASLSLAEPVVPASALPAPCVSPRPAEQRLVSCVSKGARCIPQCLAMAINRHRVFPERPRAGKRTLRGNISPLCIQIKLIMARIDPHVFVLPCKMPLGNTLSEDLAAKGRYFRPKPPNHA